MKNCNRIYTDVNCNIIIEDEFDQSYVNVYIIQYTSSDGNSSTQVILKEKESDKVICTIKKDGHYSICKIDVPLNPANPYYYKDGKFYKNVKQVDLKEIILVNPEVSKLNIENDDYFCRCHLWNCYIKVCQEIFSQRFSFDCSTQNVDNNLIYKRDLLNSALNVIDYMVSLGQYAEAQRILDRIGGCNGICDTGNSNNSQSCGCMQM